MNISSAPNNLYVKSNSRNQVYQYIYHNPTPVTKQMIVSDLKISLPTVNTIIKQFKENHYIEYSTILESTGGRPPRGLTCNSSLRFSVGLDISNHHIVIVIINLASEIIVQNRIRIIFEDDDRYYSKVGEIIAQTIEKSKISPDKILGVGISVPAIVALDGDQILCRCVLSLEGFSLNKFARFIPYACTLCNDANAGGVAELWNLGYDKDIFYISLNNTVGGAFIVNHSVYWGSTQKSAEIGHSTLVKDGRICYCGQKGCADAYISALILMNTSGGKLDTFFELLKEKSVYHLNIWNEYLDYLVTTINNIRNLYDCDVIAGGYVGEYLDDYHDEIVNRLTACNSFGDNGSYFHLCHYKKYATAVGAALHYVKIFIESVN